MTGQITDPRRLGQAPRFDLPKQLIVDDRMILPPSDHPDTVEVFRGPNIKPLPLASEAPEILRGRVLLKSGDDISTDDIVPAGARAIPLRGNVPALAEFAFERLAKNFAQRAREAGEGIIVGGFNYGQGSSRELWQWCRCISASKQYSPGPSRESTGTT